MLQVLAEGLPEGHEDRELLRGAYEGMEKLYMSLVVTGGPHING